MRPVIPPPEDFGDRTDPDDLKAWRRARRFTQDDLAEVLGVTRVTIANWETERAAIPGFLHLALESIDRRLSYLHVPQAPPKPRRINGHQGPQGGGLIRLSSP